MINMKLITLAFLALTAQRRKEMMVVVKGSGSLLKVMRLLFFVPYILGLSLSPICFT